MPTVAVFGASASLPGDEAYVAAMRLGRLLAGSGLRVVNGGYAGVMEAVSRGAAEVGGHVIGVTVPALFPMRPGGNDWLTDERPHPTLTERIHDLLSLADATVAMPGSLGTLTELMVAWNEAFIARLGGIAPNPVLAVGEPWRSLLPLLADKLVTDHDLVSVVDTVDEAHQVLVDWFANPDR
ncbi:MAG: LOG family protein [Acidimicrobiia bacterium]|nr:LOG family protein [Acidimicrobiia bacterium]